MFGDMIISCQTPMEGSLPREAVLAVPYVVRVKRQPMTKVRQASRQNEKDKAKALLNELLAEINRSVHNSTTDYNSTSGKSHRSLWQDVGDLESKELEDLRLTAASLGCYVERIGNVLLRLLKRRDALLCQQDAFCDVITQRLLASRRVPQQSVASQMRFSIQPAPGDTGFTQWVTAMKMVAQLPGGIPPEFRRRLWLQLAERHLQSRGVNWAEVERTCLTEWQNPGDGELGVQIVKDLHRTGCSLFCGEGGRHNQALLKRVLLAYARWNKAVGYCQGFNMLAALMLQVTDRCESDALKLMIYLIEGVLPDSYFADSLRGLSVDMAVFRELLRSRLPALSKHLDKLQTAAKDGGRCYEPPLTNVFTMQWFLTLFCNCLPHLTVLRVWDLILLEGNEILLRTALAIWQVLAEKIMTVRSADEFYCVMGVLTREILESGLIDSNSLIKAIVSFGPLTELKTLREHYTYNINPWGSTGLPHVVDKQVKVYPRPLALDITVLKKQYDRLRERQREARVILGAVAGATSTAQPCPARPALNHLLVGRPALGPPAKDRPKAPGGSVPPPRVLEQRPVQKVGQRIPKGGTLHWKDAPQERRKSSGIVEAKEREKGAKSPSSTSSSDTELCDESEPSSSDEEDNIDNLPKDSNEVVTNDNIDPVVPDPVEANLIEPITNVAVIDFDVDESNDPEFEQFLADRVKSLRVDEPQEEEKTNYSRRNSERAFQIMQENSMILHRILQCQTRMSPSPPSLADLDSETRESDVKLDDLETRSAQDLQSPVYGSKYTSILEKSKSLDEKYNTLILNKSSGDKEIFAQSSSSQEDLSKKMYCEYVAESDEKGIEIDSVYSGCYNDSKNVNISSSDEQQSKVTLVTDTAAQLEHFHSLNSGKSPFSLSETSVKSFSFENVEANVMTEDVEDSQNITSLGCYETNVADEDSKNNLLAMSPKNVDFENVNTNNLTGDSKNNAFAMNATNANLLDLKTNCEDLCFYNYEANAFVGENEKSLASVLKPPFFNSDAISKNLVGEYSNENLICEKNRSTDMLDYQKAEVRGEVEDLIKISPQYLSKKQTIEKSEYLLDDCEIELHLSNFQNNTGKASQSTDEALNLSLNHFPESAVEERGLQGILEQNSNSLFSIQQLTPDPIADLLKLPYFTSSFEARTFKIDEPSMDITKEAPLSSDIQSEHNDSNIKYLEEASETKNASLDSNNEKERASFDETCSQNKTDLDSLSEDVNKLIQLNKSVIILPEATLSTCSDKSPSTHEVLFSNLIKLNHSEQLSDSQGKHTFKADLEISDSHLSDQFLNTALNYGDKTPLHQETDVPIFGICSNEDQIATNSQTETVYCTGLKASDQLDAKSIDRQSLESTPYSPKTPFSGERFSGSDAETTDLVAYKFPFSLVEDSEHLRIEKPTKTESGSEVPQITHFPRYEAYLKKIAATKSLKPDSCADIPDRSPLNENVKQALVMTPNDSENVTPEYLRKLYSQSTVSRDKTSDADSVVSSCPTRTDSTAFVSDSSFNNFSRYTSESIDTGTQSQSK